MGDPFRTASFSRLSNGDLRAAVTKELDRAAATVFLEQQRTDVERKRADEAERRRNVEGASAAELAAQLLSALQAAQRRAEATDAERLRLAAEVERQRRSCSIV